MLDAGRFPVPVLGEVEVLHDPRIQLGDVVRVVDVTGAELDTLAWVVGIRTTCQAGAAPQQTLTLRGTAIENLGTGKDPYPAAQLASVERVSAALCRAHGWSAASVIGHKEWTRRKIDPSFSMSGMRTRVEARLGVRPVPAPTPEGFAPFPGAGFFVTGRRSDLFTAVGRRLVAEGCGRYHVGPGPVWGEADVLSYAAWQRELGHVGAAADGIPGRASWDRLRVPHT
ncbi:hypothetical protein GTY65_32500 [Streptomyces sp. SID8379]|uniref:peptidoglycan-binding protein n=1 Tax=unclassified Streptomyces TaxID=2593676 RepID=UPI0009973209|nr:MULTISPECIES: peptidoglycan-binding protein [unclassified Streptomyces]MYW68764.1 hypothetical protein [Streptomyces sp. SID8379]